MTQTLKIEDGPDNADLQKAATATPSLVRFDVDTELCDLRVVEKRSAEPAAAGASMVHSGPETGRGGALQGATMLRRKKGSSMSVGLTGNGETIWPPE